MVCGRLFHTGTPVVLFCDPGGYDAYRTQRRFVPLADAEFTAAGPIATPNRYGNRTAGLSDREIEETRAGNWELELLRRQVDQFVIHYDVAGTSRACFRVLHDVRGLSVHFMIDLDGTVYQTLDVKERAWHATVSNDRSLGVELANIGAYRTGTASPLDRWYKQDERGVRVVLPPEYGSGGMRTPDFVARPARPERIRGVINGEQLEMYDFTAQQYEALTRLIATLCAVLPGIATDYPRDASDSTVLRRTLSAEELAAFKGVLGHWHVQQNKVDPGPAFDWDRVVGGASTLLGR